MKCRIQRAIGMYAKFLESRQKGEQIVLKSKVFLVFYLILFLLVLVLEHIDVQNVG